MQPIAIIGAGLCGLRCAEVLRHHDLPVQVFDKSRGIGGRLATRRHRHWRFDHGCPSLHGDGAAWRQLIGGYPNWAGAMIATGAQVPSLGINQLAKDIGHGLNVHRECLISDIRRAPQSWHLTNQQGEQFSGFEHLIITVPAPQAQALLRQIDTPLNLELQKTSMSPSWVMMCVTTHPLTDHAEYRPANDVIARITAEHSKPQRQCGEGEYTYVVEATPAWSAEHEEDDATAVTQALLTALAAVVDNSPALLHCAVHRWRYARTQQPLGRPFLSDAAMGLAVAGDWCVGSCARDAYASGTALAQHLVTDFAFG